MSNKIYVAIKPAPKPDLLVKFTKDSEEINVTKEAGLTYYEDEVGYYYLQGELECTAD